MGVVNGSRAEDREDEKDDLKKILHDRPQFNTLEELRDLMLHEEVFVNAMPTIQPWLRDLAEEVDDWVMRLVKNIVISVKKKKLQDVADNANVNESSARNKGDIGSSK